MREEAEIDEGSGIERRCNRRDSRGSRNSKGGDVREGKSWKRLVSKRKKTSENGSREGLGMGGRFERVN